jgi:hypothetical protein
MAAPNGPLKFPQSYIAEGAGDLMQVTNWSLDYSNAGKVVHTQRRPGAGVVKGKAVGQITFNFAIDEGGMERDYIARVRDGTLHEIRHKCPGGLTLNSQGMYTNFKLDAPLEDATTGSCTFVVTKLS